MAERKKILFVINTLSRAGAENALMALLRKLLREHGDEYELSLFVITGQGEMADEIPEGVKLLNGEYHDESVLSTAGRKLLRKTCLRVLFKDGNVFRLFPYLVSNLAGMIAAKDFRADKLMWRVLSDGAEKTGDHYDLAVAFIEGGSTYYVADHVKADKKAAFVHIDLELAGYTRKLDGYCYRQFDRIFAISKEVKNTFSGVYPEYAEKADVFHNIIDPVRILEMSASGEGFDDGFTGLRIVTLCRLAKQKAIEVSAVAMHMMKPFLEEKGIEARWYVFGEGDQRPLIEEYIKRYGLEESFVLCGTVRNPYPYIAEADLYVHATRYEGKSIAVQEAQVLGKPIIASDCSDNSNQITDGVDGILCEFNPKAVAEAVCRLISDKDLMERLGKAASEKQKKIEDDTDKLTGLIR